MRLKREIYSVARTGLAILTLLLIGMLPAVSKAEQSLSGKWQYLGAGIARIAHTGSEFYMTATWTASSVAGPHYEIDAILRGQRIQGTWRHISARNAADRQHRLYFEAVIDTDGRSITVENTEDPNGHQWNTVVLTRALRAPENAGAPHPIDTIAQTLIEDGDPRNSAIKKHPYETSEEDVKRWAKELRDKYDLTDDEWSTAIADYFRDGDAKNHHLWEQFGGYIDQRAISHDRAVSIARIKSGMVDIFLVPDGIIEKVAGEYEADRFKTGASTDERLADFFTYAVERIMDDDGPYKPMLGDAALAEMSKLTAKDPEEETRPVVVNWGPDNKKWGCGYSEVLARMKRADPRFAMTWNVYMNLPHAAGPSGQGGTGAGITHKRRILHAGVVQAMKDCEKSIH